MKSFRIFQPDIGSAQGASKNVRHFEMAEKPDGACLGKGYQELAVNPLGLIFPNAAPG
jgi:hypothetical protein